MHDRITLPDGDVLVHAGDFCGRGTVKQARAFATWLADQPHRHKVVIAGNHDRCHEADPELGETLFVTRGCHYLFDSGVTLEQLRFYGSPWQPWFLDWAFNLPRGEALRDKWARIPQGTHVLLTHGPPMGVLDEVVGGEQVGCEELLPALDRVAPHLHVFGHIHEGYGSQRRNRTLHVNASICTVGYEPLNAPIVVDVHPQQGAQLGSGRP